MPVPAQTGGQHRVITPEMDTAIFHLLNAFPWFYQDEISQFLYKVFGVEVSQSSISVALSRITITRKKLKIEAAQRNDELWIDWQDSLQNFTADQLVFMDETGSDECTGDRSYGWAKKGESARVSHWFGKRDRISVLPAYTIEGYITAMTFTGTCTGEPFEEFIIHYLLPLCNPYVTNIT